MNTKKCPFSGQYIAAAATQSNDQNNVLATMISNTMTKNPERLKVLESYGIMDTPSEQSFDEVVRLASYICDTPIALISLVDGHRQWFKAKVGLTVPQTPSDIAFCSYTIQSDEVFVVGDALKDDRFRDNPLVTGAPGIRFYAGAPLISPEGFKLGTLCVIDTEPRELRPDQLEMLSTLSRGVMDLIESRKNQKQIRQSQEVLTNLMKLNEDFIRSRDNKREAFNRMLDYILEVTGSEYGFIGEVLYRNGEPYLKSYAVTNIAWNEETRAIYEKYAKAGMEFTNLNTLFGHTMITGEAVISNDPSNDPRKGGLPHGHPALNHYMGLPIKDSEGAMIGMLGIANKPGGYGETDISMLQPFISTCAIMVIAMQVQSQNAQMQEVQRQKDLFLANMSHEIRTPLNAIIGFNDLMSNTKLDSEQMKYVETIDIASRNLSVIINDILDISKLEAGMLMLEKKPFSIEKIVKQVIQLNSSKAKQKGIKLLLGFDHDIPPHVIGDETRLSQILINLVNNAVKFTSSGYVELKVMELQRQDDEIKIRFSVTDTGIGIPAEKAETIFERFTQAESSTTRMYGGTGLGLNIVKSLSELHGGTVRLNSQVGKGSEFIVELTYPTATQEQVRENEESIQVEQKNLLEQMHILLVEDNEHNQFLAQTYLKRNGAKVTTAVNGKVALEILK
ncbi:MAG: ATP-binding protein, partial [Bacteroidota bacterium]